MPAYWYEKMLCICIVECTAPHCTALDNTTPHSVYCGITTMRITTRHHSVHCTISESTAPHCAVSRRSLGYSALCFLYLGAILDFKSLPYSTRHVTNTDSKVARIMILRQYTTLSSLNTSLYCYHVAKRANSLLHCTALHCTTLYCHHLRLSVNISSSGDEHLCVFRVSRLWRTHQNCESDLNSINSAVYMYISEMTIDNMRSPLFCHVNDTVVTAQQQPTTLCGIVSIEIIFIMCWWCIIFA